MSSDKGSEIARRPKNQKHPLVYPYMNLDYEPIDLSALCNVGTTFAGPHAEKEFGSKTYHGLPFLVGGRKAKRKKCLIGFGGKEGLRKPLTISLGRKARYVIFAHALIESKIPEGEHPGFVAAHYVFNFKGKEQSRAPIRERFEIICIPELWGQLPFCAQNDHKDYLMPRYEGKWSDMGYRQFETLRGSAQVFVLWVWENPDPDCLIDSIIIEPGKRKFMIGAVTLGHLEEWPFPREGPQEVKISLPRLKDAQKPFNLEVEVDRGVSTFPFALPEKSAKEFLKDNRKGWGEAQNQKSSPAYVKITATPSAKVTVKDGSKELGKVNWGELKQKGRLKSKQVVLEVVGRGRNWVHTKVLDDQTGKPIPCRIHFRSPEGIPYQPCGFHDHVNSNLNTFFVDVGGDMRLGQITYAYIDGECQGWLPRGEVIVDVARGFEYDPIRTKVKMQAGQRELTLRLKRWTNMNQRRWFSGDPHVHTLGSQGGHREAQGEDLNVVNILATQLGHLFTNTEDIIGAPSVSNNGQTIVYVGLENRQHLMGHLSLLGIKKPIYPWCSDGPSEAELGGTLEVLMSHWADECHSQGGTVILPHMPNPNGEPAVMIATGRIDAVEFLSHLNYSHLEYYRYLNCGYRLPLVGGTDKMTSEVPVGICRTYAYIPPDQPFTYENWCQAIKAGRTFLSSGPMLDFSVNGVRAGDTLNLAGNGGTVEVEAVAEGIFPVHALQIIQGGKVVASTNESKGARRLSLKASLKIERHTWLAARCGGPNYTVTTHHDAWRRGIFAHTSPIYIAVGGDWWLFDRDTANYMLTLIDGGLAYIRKHTRQYPVSSVTHHHGHDDHLGFLEGPYHQARETIHRRMHQLGIPH